MRNLKFTMRYNGANYKGFQIQPKAATIQGTVENALGKILGTPGEASIIGCSRTDAGVHAKEYCFNCRVSEENGIPPENLAIALNKLLPPDIAIISCAEAEPDFHARHSAKGKEYLYLINNNAVRSVFVPSFHYSRALDIPKMEKAAKYFIGEHDFSAFCKAESLSRLKSAVRTVYDFRIEREKDFVMFYISGGGFLHNMVRIIMGTLIYVSEGKMDADGVVSALQSGKRETAGKTLPPEGLYLNKVFY